MIKITSDKEEGLKIVISGTTDLVCSEFAAILEQFYFSLKRTSDESAKKFKNFIKFMVVTDIVFSENHIQEDQKKKKKIILS